MYIYIYILCVYIYIDMQELSDSRDLSRCFPRAQDASHSRRCACNACASYKTREEANKITS